MTLTKEQAWEEYSRRTMYVNAAKRKCIPSLEDTFKDAWDAATAAENEACALVVDKCYKPDKYVLRLINPDEAIDLIRQRMKE